MSPSRDAVDGPRGSESLAGARTPEVVDREPEVRPPLGGNHSLFGSGMYLSTFNISEGLCELRSNYNVVLTKCHEQCG